MGLFSKPEVVVLKESSDAKKYLADLETLRTRAVNNAALAEKLDKEIAITKAGIYGEDSIMFELKNSGMDLVVLHDIFVESPSGLTAQIDYVVVTPYVNVIIECKNLVGNIEINNKGEFIWTFEYGGRKYKEGIYSPITQNERHVRVLSECRKEGHGALMGFAFDKMYDKYNKSLVVLANPKSVLNDRYAPKEIKNQVIRVDQLVNYLKETKSDMKVSKKEMLTFGNKILNKNQDSRKDYIEKFRTLAEEVDSAFLWDAWSRPPRKSALVAEARWFFVPQRKASTPATNFTGAAHFLNVGILRIFSRGGLPHLPRAMVWQCHHLSFKL